jgi:CRISPR-associated endonuclease/helicase Cas3
MITPRETWLSKALGLNAAATPFPWQEALLGELLAGAIPRALDLPTGLGKTSVIPIWLVARALGAPVPRRLVYVVDRRAVVDQSSTVAEGLRSWVAANPEIRAALGLTAELPVSTLRGQFVDNRRWLDDPAAPAIVVGTVDMVGSRLLFEGYGTSRKMRPYQAGLLGCDALYVLDEAHLVPAFEHLLAAVSGPDLRPPVAVPGSHLLALSATGRASAGRTFTLGERDHEHPVVRRRLHAVKRLFLLDPPGEKLGFALARDAWDLTESGSRAEKVLIFANTRDDARDAKKQLEDLGAAAADVELFVGARRVRERVHAADRLKELGFLAGSGVVRERAAFLIATSAGEIGVDLDADHMVSDVVSWERMVQRLGRVNRRGEGAAQVRVFRPAAPTEDQTRWVAAVERMPVADDGARDASPAGLRRLRDSADLGPIFEAATTLSPLRPALSRPLLDAWAMTSLAVHTGRPEPAPWIRGWIEEEPQTTVIFRTHLTDRGGRILPDRWWEAVAPHASEGLETESYRVLAWLKARAAKGHRSEDGDSSPVVALTLDREGSISRSWDLAQLSKLENRAKIALERELPGKTLVVLASLGGLRAGLLDDKADGVPETADAETWAETGFRVRETDGGATEEPRWTERARVPLETNPESGEVLRWLVVDAFELAAATEDDRSAGPDQLLVEHQAWAEEAARSLVRRLGIAEPWASAIAHAARLHDEGKKSERWQRAFRARRDGVYAKARGPVHQGILDGYRHELGSLPYAERDPAVQEMQDEVRDLVLHLIASHHGNARPVLSTRSCDDAPPSALTERAQAIALRFLRVQERWGHWGLAWWEAVLRAADQQASRRNQEQRRGGAR